MSQKLKEKSLSPEARAASAGAHEVAGRAGLSEFDDRMKLALHSAAEKKAIEPVMLDLRGIASFTDFFLIVTGESVTGQDAIAVYRQSRSTRTGQPLVKMYCATLPADLLEAELFGYERGAFPGATETKPGRMEAAHRGTLVLDEIAHLPLDAQAKLVRVIEHREFERLGGRQTSEVDARLAALTNADLKNAVERSAVRDDVFYRLNL